MAEKYKRITISQGYKLGAWLTENKDTLAKQTLESITLKANHDLDFFASIHTVRAMMTDLDFDYKRKRGGNINLTSSRERPTAKKLRMLARIVRNLYDQMGEPIPESLNMLADGVDVNAIKETADDEIIRNLAEDAAA